MHEQYPVPLAGTTNVKMWAHEHEVESQAIQQLRHIAAMPFVYGLRVMPDVHLGKGATVGSVIAMPSAISPNAVGVDIGCGVNAVKTSLTMDDIGDADLRTLRSRIEAAVPVGNGPAGYHDKAVKATQGANLQWSAFWGGFRDLHRGVQQLEDRAHKQMGTLGGGNHFIELCSDEEGSIWITLHSGSRNIGKELAERHIAIAKTLPQNDDLPDKELSVFLRDTPEMDAYRRDLTWAQEYAMRSRTLMMALIKREVHDYFAAIKTKFVTFEEEINCHHNYVSEEEIDGQAMLVTRKGAISARKGDRALIPGSMGTGSYIVTGLGNPDSFQSASHGAGRRMSRSAAKRAFLGEDEGAAQIKAQIGHVESRKDQGIVDELPQAYKPIREVIEAQSDLVAVDQFLTTIMCVKG